MQWSKYKSTNKSPHHTTQNTAHWATLTPLKTGHELRWSITVNVSCSTSGTRRVTHLKYPGQDMIKRWDCDWIYQSSFLLFQQNVGKEISPQNLITTTVKKCLYRIVPTSQTRSDIRHICQDRHIIVLDLIKCYTMSSKGNNL